MNRNRLLILSKNQFGYHIDAYYYCKYLKESFDVTYLCWDYGYPKTHMEGVYIKYIPRHGNKIYRYSHFLKTVLYEVRKDYDICFLKYFVGCSLLRVCCPSVKYVFDVRTGDIGNSNVKRYIIDAILKIESLFFSNITVISESLASKFRFPEHKVHILPLGADIISTKDKLFQDLHLLYVGTMENRNIEQTIIGFEKFYRQFGDEIGMSYRIIGSGYKQEEKRLLAVVREKGLVGVVQLLGFIPHNELGPHFDAQNIGVSFVPMTDYFDSQPPTKTFEYILSGMPVVATATSEHKKVVDSRNGVLIDDNADGFYEGLKAIFDRREEYRSEVIRKTCLTFRWDNIVKNNLKGYLEQLIG